MATFFLTPVLIVACVTIVLLSRRLRTLESRVEGLEYLAAGEDPAPAVKSNGRGIPPALAAQMREQQEKGQQF